jgi:hypothetical protein
LKKPIEKTKKTVSTKKPGRKRSAAITWGIGVIVLTVGALLGLQAWMKSEKNTEQKPAHVDYNVLAGKWLRSDGGYVMELKDVKPYGRIGAEYFNPNPIHVSRAEWRLVSDRLNVFVELRDINYPGSTYTLVYLPERDSLAGYYYQAVEGQTFDVIFMRTK